MTFKDDTQKHIPTLLKIWRKGKGGSLTKQEIALLAKSLITLQRGLTGERVLAGDGYMQKQNLLGAYLLYYWPVSYAQTSYAFFPAIKYFAKKTGPHPAIRILDIGSGPGPASAALCSLLEQTMPGCLKKISVTLTDYSPKALALSKNIFTADFPQVRVETSVINFEKQKLSPLKEKEKFNIIISSHTINELWKDNENAEELKRLFAKDALSLLAPDSLLLLQEPALLKTSRSLIQLRDFLLQEKVSILFPCPYTQSPVPCPILENPNHTCHAEQKWNPPQSVATLAKEAGLDRISFKMTFFAFTNTTSTSTDKVQLRVTSDAMLNKSGRVRFLICDGSKRIPLSAKKEDTHAKEMGFFNLNRYDEIFIEKPEDRTNEQSLAWGINTETKLKFTNYN